MRKSRFSDEQIVAILREVDRTSVAEAAKKHKVSDQTIYVWRKHFAGMAPADVERLKALESENAKLKRLLAERDLELDVMREVNRKNGEPTGAPRPGPLRLRAGRVATAGLWAARCPAVDLELPAAAAGAGRAGARGDATAVGPVSPLWLPTDPGVPPPRGPCHGTEPRAAAVAPSRAGLAAQAPAAPSRGQPAAGRCRRGRPTTSGPTTSYSTPAPTVSNSNA